LSGLVFVLLWPCRQRFGWPCEGSCGLDGFSAPALAIANGSQAGGRPGGWISNREWKVFVSSEADGGWDLDFGTGRPV